MVAQLSPEALRRGVVTYSSGNHAQGVAYAARALGAKAVIVMPENSPKVKRDATAVLGAEIVLVGPASSSGSRRPKSWWRSSATRWFLLTTPHRSSPGKGRAGWRSSSSFLTSTWCWRRSAAAAC